MYLIKDVDPEYIKTLTTQIIKRQVTQFQKWAKDLNRHFSKVGKPIANSA